MDKRDRRVETREQAIFGRSSAVGTCHGEREKKRRVPRARTYTLTQRRSGCKKRSREREREIDTRERANKKEKEREKEAWQTAYRART